MAHPALIADTGIGTAHVGVAVVAVAAPALQHPLSETVLAGPSNVIHDLVVAATAESFTDALCDVVKGFFPADLLPLAAAAFADTAQRMQDAFVVVNLVKCGRAFGAVTSTTCGVQRVALHTVNALRFVVDVTQQSAGGFAVETGCGHQRVMLLNFLRPSCGIKRDCVVPRLMRGITIQRRTVLIGHGEPSKSEACKSEMFKSEVCKSELSKSEACKDDLSGDGLC